MELLRESKVYIQTTNLMGVVSTYRLHVQNIEFNQAFKQESYKTKTLHHKYDEGWYDGSSITTANNANFSISTHMVDESSTHQHKLIELLLETDTRTLKTFTLFIDPEKEDKMYKIESCIITSGSFNLPRGGIMTAAFEGQGTKLTRINKVTLTDSSYDTTPTFAIARRVDVTVNSQALENVLGVTLEIQNDVEWTKSKTLQNSLSVTDASDSVYPANFVLSKRTVAGNITQYVNQKVTQSNANVQSWKENIPIHIKAGLSTSNYQLNAQLTPCSYTNRVNPSEAFTQSYDFRLLPQVTPLTTLIQHT